jgi:hypothetical protein
MRCVFKAHVMNIFELGGLEIIYLIQKFYFTFSTYSFLQRLACKNKFLNKIYLRFRVPLSWNLIFYLKMPHTSANVNLI